MSRFLVYFLLFLGVALLVPVLFQTIPDRKVAALAAGSLFVFLPMGVLIQNAKAKTSALSPLRALIVWKFAVLQFLMLFAIPIFVARIHFWQMDFRDVLIVGIPAPLLHRLSNASFLLMLAATGVLAGFEYWMRRRQR